MVSAKLMKRVFVALATFSIAAAVPAVAQQPVVIPAGGAGAPVADAAQAPANGPRLGPDWNALRPRFDRDKSAMTYKATHTIVISTLALVVIVVLLVLLIA